MDPNFISPEETETEKLRLIDIFKKEISTHGFLDLSSFIQEHRKIHGNHTHSGFVRSVAYKLEATGDYEVIPSGDYSQFSVKRLPKKTLEQKHPALFKIGLVVLGTLISLVSVLVQDLLKYQDRRPIYKLEDTRTSALYDSVAMIRRDEKKNLLELQNLRDSLKKK